MTSLKNTADAIFFDTVIFYMYMLLICMTKNSHTFEIQIHTSRMTLADDVNLEEFVMTKDEFSGADIKAICTEAGLLALRERRMKV